ncbi:MAG: hypothetical protein ABI960_00405 [Candidatus Eisenbacteria bacterium]
MSRCLGALAVAVLLAGCQAHEGTPPTGPGADSTLVRGVLRRYYAAIGAGDYRKAYALWGQQGEASRQSFDGFAAGFHKTAHTEVEFTGPVTLEGAAGSIFATVPVRVRATTTAGADQEFVGTYDLRRVNDVPGATPEQLRWHLYGATLHAAR